MKTSLLLLCFFSSFYASSQTYAEASQFWFTIVDQQGKQIQPPEGLSITTESDKDCKIEYNSTDSCWVMSLINSTGKEIKLNVLFSPSGAEPVKMTLLYTSYDFANKKNCQYCICKDIPLKTGTFHIDMPQQEVSWKFVPSFTKIIGMLVVGFYDISFMQNWVTR